MNETRTTFDNYYRNVTRGYCDVSFLTDLLGENGESSWS